MFLFRRKQDQDLLLEMKLSVFFRNYQLRLVVWVVPRQQDMQLLNFQVQAWLRQAD